jgi:hypothetical protein
MVKEETSAGVSLFIEEGERDLGGRRLMSASDAGIELDQ